MGIPRWTQDLTPYLETGVVTTKSDDESRLIIRDIIIDGPSLVFHVYNALALSGQAIAAGSLSEPTYIQLNSAIGVFLTDLESCGAKIERIFFDGALPFPKRATRTERLEKSRAQLERLKVLGPPPRPLNLTGDIDKDQLSTLLWQTKPSSSGSSSFISPFIVPSAIEHFLHSRWRDIISVVNGEAETYCAFTAKVSRATVLSNDSDLTLLADMQNGSNIGLLRSMIMHNSFDGGTPNITIQCWRPKHIATRLGVQSLLQVGFERSKDPSVSFATVLQRSQERNNHDAASVDFDRFTNQFRAHAESRATVGMIIKVELNNLDPRIAELACQLIEGDGSSSTTETDEFWVTLPILLEDPSKDASWSYGREMRRLSYSLLYFSCSTTAGGTCAITESSRKGPRIAQDTIETLNSTKLGGTIRNCLSDLASLPRSTGSSSTLGDKNLRGYLLWALGSVLKQRTAMGKNAIPPEVIQEYLGLDHVNPRSFLATKKARTPNYESEWRLVHLNANIHSMLYSLRMLRQACITSRSKMTKMDCKEDFVRLSELLIPMPAIPELFLDIEKVRFIMRRSPSLKSDRAFDDIRPYSGHPLQEPSPLEVKIETAFTLATSKNIRKRNKKRRLPDDDLDNRNEQSKPQKSVSTNPFDILTERG